MVIVQQRLQWSAPCKFLAQSTVRRMRQTPVPDLHNDLVGRGLATAKGGGMADQPLPSHSCYLDFRAVLHDGQSRGDSPRWEIGVIDGPTELVEDLLKRKFDGLK